MGKVRNPTTFTSHFGIDATAIDAAGAMNPVLNADTKLFINPLLLDSSQHPEIRTGANSRFRTYLGNLVKLLKLTTEVGDPSWRQADRLVNFPEIPATCLGYGAGSISGSGFGEEKRLKVLHTARHIIRLGVEDPEIFLLIPLLEENIGPDLISDMVTTIILPDLATFTERTLKPYDFQRTPFEIDSRVFQLPKNPFRKKATPVILVPKDILSKLPVATDWSEVADAAAKTAALRHKVNEFIGNIWATKTRRDKARLRLNVLKDKQAVESLLAVFRTGKNAPYNFEDDPLGLFGWRWILENIALRSPLNIARPEAWDLGKVFNVVQTIVGQFKFLVEKKGLAKLLWHNKEAHHEEVAQRLFFGIAHSYCAANNLDITPEADTGSGVVDFKFSAGHQVKVLVETKLSTNWKLVGGYEKQLEAYKESEQTMRAVYLVVDVGGMGKKDQRLVEARNERRKKGEPVSDLVFVDATIKPSASKR
jgi:hypothetical protein